MVEQLDVIRRVRRIAIAVGAGTDRPPAYFTFRPTDDGGVVEDDLVRGVHPMVGRRLNLWRLRKFTLTRLEAPEDVLLYFAVAKENPADQRLIALAQVRQLGVVRDESGRVTSLPHVERAIANCLEAIRRARAGRGAKGARLDMNHVWLQVWPVIEAEVDQLTALQNSIAPLTAGAGIEEIRADGRVAGPNGTVTPISARFFYQAGSGVTSNVGLPATEMLKPIDDYQQKVLRARRRGTVYPYEMQGLVAGVGGSSVEYDLDDSGRLAPVDRPPGLNKAGIIVGVVTTRTPLHPEGVRRVVLSGDPTRALGAVSEAECARIIAALDLAEELDVPVEWYALSAGARISMDSGTENMDWVARALKRIIEFTQAGREINIVVAGINVGAQPYWNAEATMLMHTKGILVMTPDSAMVLTGQAVAGLLRWRLGGGQLRHRWVRPGHGPERPGAVLGTEPRQRTADPSRPLRPHVCGAGRVRTPPSRDHRPDRPRRLALPPRRWTAATSRRSATSSPPGPTRTARRRSTSAP